jgi:hypothetical protein
MVGNSRAMPFNIGTGYIVQNEARIQVEKVAQPMIGGQFNLQLVDQQTV